MESKGKFKRGEMILTTERFLGYDKNEFGKLVINKEEAKIIKRIYNDYLNGKGANRIVRELEEEGVPIGAESLSGMTVVLERCYRMKNIKKMPYFKRLIL